MLSRLQEFLNLIRLVQLVVICDGGGERCILIFPFYSFTSLDPMLYKCCCSYSLSFAFAVSVSYWSQRNFYLNFPIRLLKRTRALEQWQYPHTEFIRFAVSAVRQTGTFCLQLVVLSLHTRSINVTVVVAAKAASIQNY